MNRTLNLIAACCFTALLLWGTATPGASPSLAGQGPSVTHNVPIWPDADQTQPKSDLPTEQESVASWHERFIRNVTRATMDVYLPDASIANGTAVIVCPGGAFRFLTIDGEGEQAAHWLNKRGISAFILHYRLKPTPRSDLLFALNMAFTLPALLSGKSINEVKPLALPAIADATQAIHLIRNQAAQWHVAPDRIGILGFSAGGMVAIGASLVSEPKDRPNFTAAIYSGPLDIDHVPASAPPLFAAAADDDPLTAIATRPFAASWRTGGAPVDLHIYQHGGHGFGFKLKNQTDSARWIDDFGNWLNARHL